MLICKFFHSFHQWKNDYKLTFLIKVSVENIIISSLHLNFFFKLLKFLAFVASQNCTFSNFLPTVLFQDYLKAINIVDPGLSHNRGRTLWELHTVQAFQLGQKWKKQSISKDNFKQSLQHFVSVLEDIKKCLEFSLENTFEHQIYKLSCKALVNTKDSLLFLDHM